MENNSFISTESQVFDIQIPNSTVSLKKKHAPIHSPELYKPKEEIDCSNLIIDGINDVTDACLEEPAA